MSYYLVIGNTCADSAYPFTRNVAQNTSPPLLQIGEFTLPELSTSAQIAHLLPSQLSCRLSSRLLAFVRYSFRFRLVFLLLIVTLDLLANARAQLLTVPPYAVSAVVLTLASYASDRLQSRGIFMSLAACLGGIGYLSVLSFFLCLVEWALDLDLTFTSGSFLQFMRTSMRGTLLCSVSRVGRTPSSVLSLLGVSATKMSLRKSDNPGANVHHSRT